MCESNTSKFKLSGQPHSMRCRVTTAALRRGYVACRCFAEGMLEAGAVFITKAIQLTVSVQDGC